MNSLQLLRLQRAKNARDFYLHHYSEFILNISISESNYSDEVSMKITLNSIFSEHVRFIYIEYTVQAERDDAFCFMYSQSNDQLFVNQNLYFDFFEEDISILNGNATSHKLFLTDFFSNISKFEFSDTEFDYEFHCYDEDDFQYDCEDDCEDNFEDDCKDDCKDKGECLNEG